MRDAFGKIWPVATSALLALALAACGSPAVTGTPTARSPDDGKGSYKVGRPYVIDGLTYYPAEDWEYDQTGMASWYGPGFHGRPTANGEIYDQHAVSAAHPTLPLPSYVQVTNLDNGREVVARVNDRGPFKSNRIIDLSRAAAREIGLDVTGTAKVRVRLLRRESEAMKAVALQGGNRVAQMAAIENLSALPVAVAAAPAPAATPVYSAPVADRTVTAVPLPSPAAIAPPQAQVQAQPQIQAQRPVAQPAPAYVPPAQQASAPAQLAWGAPISNAAYQPSVPAAAGAAAGQYFVQAGAFSQAENAERLRQQLASMGDAHVLQISVSGRDFYRVRVGPMARIETADEIRARIAAAGHGDARVVTD